ncbi:hypothetical protein AGMMS49928_13240 [Spirochaetia bacterium]|nr:hypothetical protein AGMMS49928_13240 [Spirochaetia bacterium]
MGQIVEQKAIFDKKKLLDNFSGDKEGVLDVLKIFIRRTENQLKNFPGLILREEWENAWRDAHTIVGSGRILSAEELGGIAERLERSCKNKDNAEAAIALPLLEESFARFREKAADCLEELK